MQVSVTVKEFVDKLCSADNRISNAMSDKVTRNHVEERLVYSFKNLVYNYPSLVEDVQDKVVNYYKTMGNEAQLGDFVALVDWYRMSFDSHPKDYYDVDGKYYQARLVEVINMFLVSKNLEVK